MANYNTKNLIILLGNGFDLAHEAKTSYKDFIESLSEEETHDNQFLKDLLSDNYENWCDIENYYYKKLVGIFNQLVSLEPQKERLTRLNKHFNDTKELLALYLKTIEIKVSDSVEKFMEESTRNHSFDKIVILNFNYTNSIKLYMDILNKTVDNEYSIENIRVHGELESDNIIFGYGDDTDEYYKRFKDSQENGYLNHMKTFDYINDSTYVDAIETVNSLPEYHVMLLGHSLEKTDKTLLKEILDKKECKKIHIHKRLINENEVKDEYLKLVYALSRIISNDSDLRMKVIPFDESTSFPNK